MKWGSCLIGRATKELCKAVAHIKDVFVDSQLNSLKESVIENFFTKYYLIFSNQLHSFQLNGIKGKDTKGYSLLRISAHSKATPQHQELRALLFLSSAWILLHPAEL